MIPSPLVESHFLSSHQTVSFQAGTGIFLESGTMSGSSHVPIISTGLHDTGWAVMGSPHQGLTPGWEFYIPAGFPSNPARAVTDVTSQTRPREVADVHSAAFAGTLLHFSVASASWKGWGSRDEVAAWVGLAEAGGCKVSGGASGDTRAWGQGPGGTAPHSSLRKWGPALWAWRPQL